MWIFFWHCTLCWQRCWIYENIYNFWSIVNLWYVIPEECYCHGLGFKHYKIHHDLVNEITFWVSHNYERVISVPLLWGILWKCICVNGLLCYVTDFDTHTSSSLNRLCVTSKLSFRSHILQYAYIGFLHNFGKGNAYLQRFKSQAEYLSHWYHCDLAHGFGLLSPLIDRWAS